MPEHVLTVVDQAYFEYIDRPDYPDAVERYLKAGRRVVVLRTFSKIYGLAGLRVGYAVGPRGVCAAMAKVRRPFDMTTPAQVAARREHRRRRPRSRAAARSTPTGSRASRRSLREHGLEPVPSVGNFVYVETGGDANALFERLLREGVIVRPLAGFGSPTAIRVSVGTPEELDALRGRARPRARTRVIADCAASRPPPPRVAVLRQPSMYRLLFLATLGSGLGTWMATIALTVDVDDAHAFDLVGERALHRHVPAGGRRRARCAGPLSTASRASG